MPEILTDSKDTAPQKANESEEEFLRRALARWQLAQEATIENRRDSLDDVEFSIGKQWPENVKGVRVQDGRPCLTMNRIPQNLKLLINEQRQQRPALEVNPVGDGADVETAEILQGIFRHIEIASDAEIAYDHAFGYWRVRTDYRDVDSDEQDIFIEWIRNQFSVALDPAASLADKSDMRWAFIIEDMPIEEYKLLYPKSEMAKLDEYRAEGNAEAGWMGDKFIRLAEYYYVLEEVEPIGGRKVTRRTVKYAKINARERLEEHDILGSRVPIIPVLGEEVLVNGKLHLAGLVRYMKDPARQYNYWVSSATEIIALAPKAPFVGAVGQFATQEEKWRTSNTRSWATLEYDPIDVHGNPVGPPQRQQYEPPIQAIQAMTRQADADLKYTSGINAASLGDQESERSGKAILLRQKQSDITNLNWSDNLARSIRSTGRLILDWIPKVYDTPRIQRIVKPDGTVSHVITHSGSEQVAAAQGMMTEAIQKIYDLGTGKYDVTVSVGPSYQSKRQEAVASQLAFLQSFPQAAPFIGDLVVRNMDWPGANDIADRLKKMLPPQLLDQADGDPKAQLQQAQAQLRELSQQHQLLVQHVQQLTQQIETKQVEVNWRERIEKMKIGAQIAIAEIEAKTQSAQERLKWQQDAWLELHGAAHEAATQAAEQAHERTTQAAQQAHEQDLAQQQQASQAEQQQAAQEQPQGGNGQ